MKAGAASARRAFRAGAASISTITMRVLRVVGQQFGSAAIAARDVDRASSGAPAKAATMAALMITFSSAGYAIRRS